MGAVAFSEWEVAGFVTAAEKLGEDENGGEEAGSRCGDGHGAPSLLQGINRLIYRDLIFSFKGFFLTFG